MNCAFPWKSIFIVIKKGKNSLSVSYDYERNITIQILPNISRSKGNQALKLDQLIEYDKNIILKKSYLIVVEKLKLDPFMKNQDWAYL